MITAVDYAVLITGLRKTSDLQRLRSDVMDDLHRMLPGVQINHLTLGITCGEEIALLKQIVKGENAAKDHKYEVAARVAAEGGAPTEEENAKTEARATRAHESCPAPAAGPLARLDRRCLSLFSRSICH